jgi:hypothetical protein
VGSINRRIAVQVGPDINAPYSKMPKAVRAGSVAQVVNHLPGRRKTLSSNTSTARRRRRKRRRIFIVTLLKIPQIVANPNI